jgi:hypothetical protein
MEAKLESLVNWVSCIQLDSWSPYWNLPQIHVKRLELQFQLKISTCGLMNTSVHSGMMSDNTWNWDYSRKSEEYDCLCTLDNHHKKKKD